MDLSSALVEDIVVRAERVQLYVGDRPDAAAPNAANGSADAVQRLRAVQRAVSAVCAKHPAAQVLLNLRQDHPDLFIDGGSASFSMAEQLAVLKAYTNTIPTFQSQLSLAQDLHLPPLDSFLDLASIRPNLDQLEKDIQTLGEEMEDLRRRSAALLQRWYEVAVLAGGDCWVEWERRLEAAEREIRRQEVLQEEGETP